MLRARISKKLDTNRTGDGLAKPGIDPRQWVSLAYANGESVVDAAHGVFVDVTLVPTNEVITARVTPIYGGNGFGLYAKVHADDELVVLIPNGNTAMGGVVVSRVWTAADLPPTVPTANVDDLILVVEKDKNLRISTQGQGQVFIESAATVTVNCPDIRLGDLAPSDYAAMAQKTLDQLTAIQDAFNAHMHATAAVGAPSPPTPVPGQIPIVVQTVACTTTKVK